MHFRSSVTVLLAIILALYAFAGKGQSISTEKVTIGLKNEPLNIALKEIEQQSVFRFFYRDADINQFKHLNLPQATRTIDQTLQLLFQNTLLSFRQMGNSIFLERTPQKGSFDVRGRVINGTEKKPLDNVSVFITNATIGGKTAPDGTFTLRSLKPGEYDIVVSMVGFETYSRHIAIENKDIDLGDIEIFQRQIVLSEVKVKAVNDPDWERNFAWFKEEFLGTSKSAAACKILNPEVLDFNYDEDNGALTASAQDFLIIENYALGYRLKYLLTDFVKDTRIKNQQDIFFEGYVWFEEMRGSAAQEVRWKKKRRGAYEGSMMHFLRSGLSNNLDEQGFLVYRIKNTLNPARPADSVIVSKTTRFERLKKGTRRFKDSLNYWKKKSDLPKYLQTLEHTPLKQEDFISLTNHKGIYALASNGGSIYLDFDKKHHFRGNERLEDVYSTNARKTLIDFNAPYVLFDKNGCLLDPSCISLIGAMTKERIADLLPVDYDYTDAGPSVSDEIRIFSGQSRSLKSGLLKLKARSDSLSESNTSEKPCLQFDKPYYAAGDTIWFKAYLFNAASLTPSDKSRIMYLDIVNDSAKIVKRLSIPVSNGLGWGNIGLDDINFSPGTYTLRAYTNWMRNWGDDHLFNKTFYVAGTGERNWLVNKQVIDTNGTANIRLQFSNIDRIPAANIPLQLQVFAGNKHLYRQTILTDKNGLLNFNLKFPEKEAGLIINAENTTGDKKVIIPITLNRYKNADVQFLPEGGDLVAGLPAHIGFKAIGEDGKGVNVAIIITGRDQKKIAEFKTLHNGMGSFDLPVQAGENYTAKLTFPDGSIKEYQLSAAKSSGSVLRVRNRLADDSLDVSVEATNDIIQQGDSYFLIGRARGIICYAAVVNFRDNHFIKINIAKQLFPTGIAHFTLMTAKGQPLNERLVYVDRHDNLDIKITAAKDRYIAKDSVGLQLRVTDNSGKPVSGNFSLAVTDDAQVKTDTLNNENIITRMLLTSDLKGYVEAPGYYLSSKTAEVWQALDNLLLTQGWVGYDWKQVFDPPVISFQPEHELEVKGKVINVFNKPVKGTNVLLFSKTPAILMDTLTDKEGKFIFDHFPRVDTPIFVLKAVNKSGKSFNVGINVDEVKPPDFIKPAGPLITPWYVNSDSTLLNYTKNYALLKQQENFPAGGHILKEVKITGKKIIKGSQNLNGPGNADVVLDEKDLEAAGKKTWLQLLQENVPKFTDGFFAGGSGLKALKDLYLAYFVTDENPFIEKVAPPEEWYFVDGKPLMLIVDGISVNQIITVASFRDMTDYLTSHSAEDIKGFEIIHSTQYTSAYFNRYQPHSPIDLVLAASSGFPPVLIDPSDFAFVEITTRSGHGPAVGNTPGMYLYKPLPLSWPKQFYKPKYAVKDTARHLPDLRSTIDWEPNITTGVNGEAKLWFYTADKPSTYTIIIEGTDMNGNLGYKRGKINMDKPKEKAK